MSADLRERIEILEEENLRLKALLAPPLSFPAAWKLAPQQSALLAALYAQVGYVPSERQRIAVCGFDGNQRERYEQTILVHLRKKLHPLGITFVSRYKIGVCLPPESRAIVRGALAAIAAGTVA